MAKTTKPTKQQIAQAKARAGGNNPVKVTNAELKKLGSGALIAASFTPAGRAVKVAATAVKAAKTAKAASIAQKKNYAQKVTTPAKRVAEAAKREKETGVKVVPARGSSYNKVANQKEAERLARTATPKTTSKNLRGTARQDYEVAKIPVTKNVTARVPAKSNYEFAKDMTRFEKIRKQSLAPAKTTKAEAKANARGLKAANKGTKKMENVPKDVSDRFNATVKRLAAEEAKKKKK
jgi:hypothetical protein